MGQQVMEERIGSFKSGGHGKSTYEGDIYEKDHGESGEDEFRKLAEGQMRQRHVGYDKNFLFHWE